MIFGPISDAVNEKLANDMPNEFILASKCLQHHSFTSLKMLKSLNWCQHKDVSFFQRPSPKTQEVRNPPEWCG